MIKHNRTLLVILILLLAIVLLSCNRASDCTSETSQSSEKTTTSITKLAQTTPAVTTPVKSVPTVPDSPDFDIDFGRAMEIIASQENIIIVGNGGIHEIKGHVPESYPSFYPDAGDFRMCGIGRYKADHLPAIQYSADRSVIGLKMFDEWRYKSDLDPGTLIIYDGADETVVAQGVLSFALSADGKQVAYRSKSDACLNGESLYLFDRETGVSTMLSDCAGPSYVLSMTGKSIAFTEYSDGSSTASWRVVLKIEGLEEQELTQNMIPVAVSDDGAYAYALQGIGDDKYDLWSFHNGTNECIGKEVIHTFMNPIILNRDCSQVIFSAVGTYFSQNGEKGTRLDIEGNACGSTALFQTQYMMQSEQVISFYERPEVHTLCADTLWNVVHVKSDEKYRIWLQSPDETLSFWFFDENLEAYYLSVEEVYQLYDGHDEYLIQLDQTIEQEAYAYRLHETIYQRDGEPDIMYCLDTENGGRNATGYLDHWNYETSEELRLNYINAHYYDLYMLEEPYDGTPIKVAENVSQVWSDEFGVYYICLEEIDQNMKNYFANPSKYIYEDPDSGTMFNKLHIIGDKNGLYYSTDATTFQRVAYTVQSYLPTGLG